jgi:membrane fusion protein, copper/silver efflux system
MGLFMRSTLVKYSLIVSLVGIMLGAVACGQKQEEEKVAGHTHDTYTCPMHPQIREKGPGRCPICGMDLVKVATNPSGAAQQKQEGLMLSEAQLRLANVQVDTVGTGNQARQTILTGTLAVNANETESISSRVTGRIERLYIRQTGERVRKGAPLMDVYSEQLQTLQQEYLLAVAQRRELGDPEGRYSRLVEAAAQKLELLGMTASQIQKLATTGKASPTVTFFSPASGVVQEIAVTEGQYVNEGSRLASLTDLSTIWVEAQLYPWEASRVETGSKVEVQVEGFLKSFTGKVAFINPELQPGSKVLLMRVEIANPSNQLLPGMPANVQLSEQKQQVITLPLEAVLRDSKGSYVWKQTGENTFRPVMVRTGSENANTIEINAGLEQGDRVVVSGAYLLHSEYTLRNGSDPMAGHQHSTTEM